MDFSFSAAQLERQAQAKDFATRVLAPRYQARDKEQRIEPEVFAEMGALGLIAPELPRQYGGRDASRVESGLITEQIARGDFNVAYTQVVASLVGQVLLNSGNHSAKETWLRGMTAGTTIVGIGLSEPHGGSDAGSPRLRAERVAGGWRLNGTKSMSFSHTADAAVVFARTSQTETRRARGISAFLVPLANAGVTRELSDDLGTRAVTRGFVSFKDCEVPDDHLLGNEGAGFTDVMRGFDFSRALIALQCLAVAEQSVEETWDYTSKRVAFDKPLSTNQGVAFPLAEAMTKIQLGKLMSYKALWLKDNGSPHTSEAAMAKWWAPEVSSQIIHQCLLLHGQFGYKQDLPFAQRLRDVIGLEIGDGTAQIMKLIIARNAIGREFAP